MSRGPDQLPNDTILRIYNQLELSLNSLTYNSFANLVDLINTSKRMEPQKVNTVESARISSSPAEENEKSLRTCVKSLVEEGYNGKRLGLAKKILWPYLKTYDFLLEEAEIRKLLMENYW